MARRALALDTAAAAEAAPRSGRHGPRRGLAAAAVPYRWLEVGLDRGLTAALNPLHHTGTIAVFALAVATVTGIYLFLFYRVGTAAAHASVEAIGAQPFGIGALMRSLHRYSSDAALVAAGLHGLKMLLSDRFWGPRWLGWVTGLALLALIWFTGATGYWLVWDMQALVLSTSTARALDVLPFFTEPVIQTFARNDAIQNFLFFIVLFVHITVPLLLGAAYWLHVMRLARPRFLPPAPVLVAAGAALVAVSLLRPAASGPSADPARLPGTIPVDWFYFPYFPLTDRSPWLAWALVIGGGLVVAAVPWLLRGPAPATAAVETAACTGCSRCYRDCPYEAIAMRPRQDGGRPRLEAVVDPARCVGCGICLGACDTRGIRLGDEPDRSAARLRAGLAAARRAGPDRAPVVVVACRLAPGLAGPLGGGDPPAALIEVPCVGLVHPDLIADALAAGAAGVFIAGCRAEDCPCREGPTWLAERLAGRRPPALRGVPAARVRLRGYAPVEGRRALADVAAFARELG